MYVIKDKKHRNHVFVFQDENGTQKEARYHFKESAENMLAILNKNCDRYYIALE